MTLRQFSTLVLVLAAALGIATKASALPSYARQTGLACNGCHTTPPELNQAGLLFKLLGYTDKKQDSTIPTAQGDKRRPELEMLENLPLGAWFEMSNSSTNKAQPGSQGDSFEFPQDISLFLAGAWADHLGSFLQVTYDAQANQFGMDNTDIRYARKVQRAGKDWIFGITLNNNPTLEDVWNATPAWGYPFIASDSAPTPAAAAILQGGLAQDVAGAGGYTMWDNHLYLAGAIYRSDHIGSPQPNTGSGSINIQNVAPYWRVAWQRAAPKDVSRWRLRNASEFDAWNDHGCRGHIHRFRSRHRIRPNAGPRRDLLPRHLSAREHDAQCDVPCGGGLDQSPPQYRQRKCRVSLWQPVVSSHGVVPDIRNRGWNALRPSLRHWQREWKPQKHGLYRQLLLVAKAEYRPGRSVHRLCALQRRKHKLRRKRAQCQR